MKRTFLAKRNGLLSPTDVSWGVFALTLALVVLGVRLLAPNFFWYVFTPVFRSAETLSGKGRALFSGFENAATLAKENERLQEENTALTLENQALIKKEASTAGLSLIKEGILAGVVARPPESPYDTLVLAAGAKAGVTLGQEAFGGGGVPLGVVSSVLPDFSRVTLFSTHDFVTSGWVGDTNLPISLQGAGAGAMSATVARAASIKVGDTVFVPGPGMLPIGKVARIDSDPSVPGVTLRIQSTLNLFSVAWVTLRDTGTTFSIVATSSQP